MTELIQEKEHKGESPENGQTGSAQKVLGEHALEDRAAALKSLTAQDKQSSGQLPSLSIDSVAPLKVIEVPPSEKYDSPEWSHKHGPVKGAPGNYMPDISSRVASPDSRVAAALERVNTDEIKKSLDDISGNNEVVIDGQKTRLESRSTHGPGYEKALDYFKDKFEKDGFKVVMDTYTKQGETLHNLRAIKVGNSKPDEVVMFGAHIDSTAGRPWSKEAKAPGADDDGSGAVALQEIAHVMRDLPLDRTVVLSLFSGEEQGLWGSRAMAELYRQSQDNITKGATADGDTKNTKIVGMYQMDMVGYAPQGNTVESHDTSDQEAPHKLTEVVNAAAQKYQLDVKVYGAHNDNVNDRSDHGSFMNVGIPAVAISEPYDTASEENPNYHSVKDTVATMNIPYLANVSKLMAATGVELAGLQGK